MSDRLPYRSFSTTFKEAAVLRISRGDPLMPLSRELGVPRKLLYNWFNAWKVDGVAGLNRKRGRARGTKLGMKVSGKTVDAATATDAKSSELASAKVRITELEGLVSSQQIDLDFFAKSCAS